LIKLDTIEKFEEVVEKGEAFTLLKHSVTCPISQAAYDEYAKFTAENQNKNSYYLTVQEARPLSNYIAEKFQIKHESPQAFFVANKGVAWHASHWKITYDVLKNVSEENQ
jgi:bacillithiol system protein YtxJ